MRDPRHSAREQERATAETPRVGADGGSSAAFLDPQEVTRRNMDGSGALRELIVSSFGGKCVSRSVKAKKEYAVTKLVQRAIKLESEGQRKTC